MCRWNCRELLHILWWKFMDLSLLRNFFNLDTYLLKRTVLRASNGMRNFDHFRPRLDFFFGKVQSKPLLSSHLSIVTCCAYTKLRWSHKPSKPLYYKIENTDLSLWKNQETNFNQLQIYQACLICNRARDWKYVTATRLAASLSKSCKAWFRRRTFHVLNLTE